jgi:electron transport complex protein RnfC
LVQYYRYAKSEIIAADKATSAADLARERNDFRLARIEREKLERAQKHAERAQLAKESKSDLMLVDSIAVASANTETPSTDQALDKKAIIAAAIERAKAKKLAATEAGVTPKNIENVSALVQAEINTIDHIREQAALAETAKTPTN